MPISRRRFLLASPALAACGRKKATGFPGLALVANREGRSLAAIDLTRFRLARQIALDAPPSLVLAHPTHARAYALSADTGTVYEVDGRDLAITRRARPGAAAIGMRFAPSADSLWVAYREPAQLVELPLDSLTPRRRIALPAPPDDWDISRENQALAAFYSRRSIAVVSLAHSRIERTIAAPAEPSIVRFQSDGRQVLAGSRQDRTVTIFETASGRTVVRLPIAVQPRRFCFSADGGHLFITGEGMDGVVIVYPYDTDVAETILAGHAPGEMAVTDSAPLYLLVANPQSRGVTVLDIETRKLVAVLNVGQDPGPIVITPDRQYALVVNRGSGDVAVVRIARLPASRYKSAPIFTMIPAGEGPVSAAVVTIASA